jgi:RES domain
MNREVVDDISTDLCKFPEFTEYKAQLESLISTDLSVLSYEEIGRLFYEKAILFQQAFGLNPNEQFNERTFYRARFNLREDEDPNLIRTYSYPPPQACKANGRANLKGKAVFYCAEHAGAAILESKPSPGSKGYMSVWNGNATRPVKYGICLPKSLREENIFRQMAVDIDNFVNTESERFAGDKAEHFTHFFRFIADRFVNESAPYPLTSWIANEMLYEGRPKDYIIYPSAAHFHYSCNLAFHPNGADTLLQFRKVWRFTLISIEGPIIKTTDHEIGEMNCSRMIWRKPERGELQQLMPGGQYY